MHMNPNFVLSEEKNAITYIFMVQRMEIVGIQIKSNSTNPGNLLSSNQ